MASATMDPVRPTDLKEFTLFPKLAPELRDMIWKLALPKPRTISTFVKAFSSSIITPLSGPYAFKLVSNACSMLLGVFQACQESRAIALNRYVLAFKSQLEKPLYFDWKNDTIYFHHVCDLLYLSKVLRSSTLEGSDAAQPRTNPNWRNKVCRIALRGGFFNRNPYVLDVIGHLSSFTGLTTLVIEEIWPTSVSRPQNQHSINDENKRALYKAWKKQLEIDDGSKLPKVIWLTPDEMNQMVESERIIIEMINLEGSLR
ncbi:hypothetical protein N431DRAFT_454710 [Stipitochalara longipes BDJ]|nr:hypothetical protein N431DRAFT_454710 [Stipitochalara longipes BDJ]